MKKSRTEAYYAESIHRVWRALTDPAELSLWLMTGKFKARRGYRFKCKETETKEEALCEIQEVEEPRRLAYRLETLNGSVSIVTWSLEAVGEGTRVIVEQELIVTSELRLHPSVISLAQYRNQRSLLKLEAVA